MKNLLDNEQIAEITATVDALGLTFTNIANAHESYKAILDSAAARSMPVLLAAMEQELAEYNTVLSGLARDTRVQTELLLKEAA